MIAYGRYLDGHMADDALALALAMAERRYRRQCRARGIDPDFVLSGLKRPPKRMPNLSKPKPVVD